MQKFLRKILLIFLKTKNIGAKMQTLSSSRVCFLYKFLNLVNYIIMKNKMIWKNILLGIIAGGISGFFSSGGGLVLVPYMTTILKMDEVEARATTIFCIFFMVFTSGCFYFGQNYIDWQMAIKCAIGGIIGGYIGSKILIKVSRNFLKISFILFLLYAGIKMI